MKKILIAIDYDPGAQKVAETGYKLAKNMDAQVTLLHVISDAVNYSSMYSPVMGYTGLNASDILQLDNTSKIKEAAENFLERSRQHLGDDKIQTLVTEGSFADSILETAKEMKADII